jgi:solute carrier family 25 protein 38
VLISVLLFIMSDSAFPSTSQAHATMHHSISAASAGSIATLITHPFDVIKASC